MAQQGVFFLVYFLIYATTSSLVLAITLPNQVTPKPRHTKFSSSTTEPGSGSLVTPSTTAAAPKEEGVAEFRFFNTNGETCILMRTDAVVEVTFLLHNLEETVSSFIPDKAALVDGDCSNQDESFMRISWSDFNLVFYFEKTPGGEKWFIEKIELTVNAEKFSNLNKHGKPVKLYHKGMLTATRSGRSFSCAELDIDLETDEKDHPPKGIKGSLLLRLLQLQPFMYKGKDFEPAVECKPQTFYTDETAPIAVGSTLAIAVLMTVTGYAIFRYFKVKNVQYNTME